MHLCPAKPAGSHPGVMGLATVLAVPSPFLFGRCYQKLTWPAGTEVGYSSLVSIDTTYKCVNLSRPIGIRQRDSLVAEKEGRETNNSFFHPYANVITIFSVFVHSAALMSDTSSTFWSVML